MLTKFRVLTTLAAIAALGAACGDDSGSPIFPDGAASGDSAQLPDAPPGGMTIRLNDDITQDTTFTAQNQYVIPRLKALFVRDGATLTIEPGTTIYGEQGAVLVITRGSKIMAEGTAEAPILLTSAQPDGMHTRGYWGGLLVLGNAPINTNVLSMVPSAEATYEAFTSAIPEGKFGGDDPADDSGVIKYVRIEFAGFNFVSDREFNNLTLAGVGSGTVVDYVQVHGGSDDGVELFGGTVNVKHIVSSQNADDGFDTDNGWVGNAQFIIIQHVAPSGSEPSNGYESDNHGTAASYAAEPRTLPTVYNVTIIGDASYTAGTSWAMVLRRGTGGHYFNHLITGFPSGIEVRDVATKDQLDAGNLFFKNSIIFGNGPGGDPWPAPQTGTGVVDIEEEPYFANVAWSNRFTDDPGLTTDMLSKTAPNFKPSPTGAAMTGAAVPEGDFFDHDATFVGAIGTVDWTAGWTRYPQPMN